MTRARRLLFPLLPLLTALALAGCGGDDDDGGSGGGLDRDALEADISQRLAQATGSSAPNVVCPSDLPAQSGATIRCRVDVQGTSYGVTVTVLETDGGAAKYDLQVDAQ